MVCGQELTKREQWQRTRQVFRAPDIIFCQQSLFQLINTTLSSFSSLPSISLAVVMLASLNTIVLQVSRHEYYSMSIHLLTSRYSKTVSGWPGQTLHARCPVRHISFRIWLQSYQNRTPHRNFIQFFDFRRHTR